MQETFLYLLDTDQTWWKRKMFETCVYARWTAPEFPVYDNKQGSRLTVIIVLEISYKY